MADIDPEEGNEMGNRGKEPDSDNEGDTNETSFGGDGGGDVLGGDGDGDGLGGDGDGDGDGGDNSTPGPNPADTIGGGGSGAGTETPKTSKGAGKGRGRGKGKEKKKKWVYEPPTPEEYKIMDDMLESTDYIRGELAKDSDMSRKVLDDLKFKESILWKVYGARLRGVHGPETRSFLRSLRITKTGSGVVNGLGYKNDRDPGSGGNTYAPRKGIVGYRGGRGVPYESSEVYAGYTAHLKKVAREYANTLQSKLREDEGEDISMVDTRRRRPATPKTPKTPGDDTPETPGAGGSETPGPSGEPSGVPSGGPADDDDVYASAEEGPSLIGEDTYKRLADMVTRDIYRTIDSKIDRVQGADPSISEGSDHRSVILTDQDIKEIRQAFGLAALRQSPGDRVVDGLSPHQAQMDELDVNIAYFDEASEKAKAEGDDARSAILKDASDVSKLTKDYIRVRRGIKPEHDESLNIAKEAVSGSGLVRSKRFMNWLRNNMVGIGGILASVVGFVTSIIMAMKDVATAVADGSRKYSKALAAVAAMVGIGGAGFMGLFRLVKKLIEILAETVGWITWLMEKVSENIWLTAVVVSAALYELYGDSAGRMVGW